MGLYYKVIVGDELGNNREVYKPYVLMPSGEEKLMGYKMEEHMDITNLFMNGFSHMLKDNPKRVIWVLDEDFSERKVDEKTGLHLLVGKRMYKGNPVAIPTHEEAWGKGGKSKAMPLNLTEFEYEYAYLVNYDKKMYLDMYKYVDKNMKVFDRGSYTVTSCPSPIPLLTNEDKPCDYETIADKDFCLGAWAWDLISYSSTIPKGFKEVEW